MSYQQTSMVYYRALPGQIPAGQIVHVDDYQGGVADIYFHHRHARAEFVWDFNWITRHHVGHGLWRQRWTHDGRLHEPQEGRGVAIARWEIVSPGEMPRGRYVFPVEEDGLCTWLIRSGSCTEELQETMNCILERAVGDGLWWQAWHDEQRKPAVPTLHGPPLLTAPV
ncbi:hypothetical protein ACH4UM_19205 [Streptomyces sp. NPDC020801]|uniref:hypothetical protein n=1 Tax=Streptomyces sp. NPDC020801 TaxID=3365093 RepID=UPI0037A029DC